jgi:alkanesulfonate monooxygenase SsuD/methylene tetrahydromethanopterin reductase-like flavin-dependent oxidoreductase (luciferase family)
MSILDMPYRAPGVLAAELATVDYRSNGRLNVGVGAGWMPEEFAAASASHIYPQRHQQVRETIEIMQGIWTNSGSGAVPSSTSSTSSAARARSAIWRSAA